MLSFLRNYFFGIFLGIGQLFPAVGWQTLSLAMGIYDDLLTFLSQLFILLKDFMLYFFSQKTKDEVKTTYETIKWKLGLPLFFGILTTITISAIFITQITAIPVEESSLLAVSFGIILGTLSIMKREFIKKSLIDYGLLLVTGLAFFAYFSLPSILTLTKDTTPILFVFVGTLTSIFSLFPGNLSNVTLSLFSSTPNTMLNIIAQSGASLFSFGGIIFLSIGLLFGLLLSAVILAKGIIHYRSLFQAFILGITLASLKLAWPFRIQSNDVFPWQLTLTAMTQQLIIIGVSFGSILILRLIIEKSQIQILGFGTQKRTIIS